MLQTTYDCLRNKRLLRATLGREPTEEEFAADVAAKEARRKLDEEAAKARDAWEAALPVGVTLGGDLAKWTAPDAADKVDKAAKLAVAAHREAAWKRAWGKAQRAAAPAPVSTAAELAAGVPVSYFGGASVSDGELYFLVDGKHVRTVYAPLHSRHGEIRHFVDGGVRVEFEHGQIDYVVDRAVRRTEYRFHLLQLPEEVLLHVLKHLPGGGALAHLGPTCAMMLRLVHSGELWREISFPKSIGRSMTDARLATPLARVDARTFTSSISLQHCCEVNGSGLAPLAGSTALRSLDLRRGIIIPGNGGILLGGMWLSSAVLNIVKPMLATDGSTPAQLSSFFAYKDDFEIMHQPNDALWHNLCLRTNHHCATIIVPSLQPAFQRNYQRCALCVDVLAKEEVATWCCGAECNVMYCKRCRDDFCRKCDDCGEVFCTNCCSEGFDGLSFPWVLCVDCHEERYPVWSETDDMLEDEI